LGPRPAAVRPGSWRLLSLVAVRSRCSTRRWDEWRQESRSDPSRCAATMAVLHWLASGWGSGLVVRWVSATAAASLWSENGRAHRFNPAKNRVYLARPAAAVDDSAHRERIPLARRGPKRLRGDQRGRPRPWQYPAELEPSLLKLDRATAHLDELRRHLDDWAAANCRVFDRLDPESGDNLIWIELDAQPPVDWALVVGDFAGNLRASPSFRAS
jgi:hypothetical protein